MKAQLILFDDDEKHPTTIYTFDTSKIDIVMTPGSGGVDKVSLEGVLTDVFRRKKPEPITKDVKQCSSEQPHIPHFWHDDEKNWRCPGYAIVAEEGKV